MNIIQSVFRQTGLVVPEVPLGNELKSAIQKATLSLVEKIIVLEWCTGSSKTLAALYHTERKRVLIACKQLEHFKTWTGEMELWGISPSELTLTSYRSLPKYANQHFDVIILDEAQIFTELALKNLREIQFDKLIVCSATIPIEVHQRLSQLGKPRIIRIPIAKAIEWKMVPAPRINVIQLPLDNVNRNLTYKRHQKRFPEGSRTINFNDWNNYKTKWMNLDVLCTQKEYYSILEDEFVMAREAFFKCPDCRSKPENMSKETQFFYNMFLMKGGMRKKFLGTIRTPVVKRLMEKLEGQRLVVFANSIEQCDELGKGYPVVHSQSKDKAVVEQFNNYQLDKLFSVKQLDESMNLVGEFSAILVSLGGSNIQATQRIGRSLRSDNSQIYLFLTSGTRDDAYFKEFKQGLDESFFNYLTIDMI